MEFCALFSDTPSDVKNLICSKLNDDCVMKIRQFLGCDDPKYLRLKKDYDEVVDYYCKRLRYFRRHHVSVIFTLGEDEACDYKVLYGKYKGKRFWWLLENDKKYAKWFMTTLTNERARNYLKFEIETDELMEKMKRIEDKFYEV